MYGEWPVLELRLGYELEWWVWVAGRLCGEVRWDGKTEVRVSNERVCRWAVYV